MTKTPLISVIVPVHNPGSFLKNCLNSIVNQTYSNIEIIIIDDDSTDDSASIIKQYQLSDKRISYYKTVQHNAARSRQLGIKKSTAKYVCFVDSDDIVQEGYVEILYKSLVKSGATISTGKISTFVNEKDFGYKKGDSNKLHIETDLARYFMDNYDSSEKSRHISQSINAKMYDKSLLESIDYSVIKSSILEDNYIMPQILKHAIGHKMAVVDSTIYYYRQNPNSTMATVMDRKIEYDGKSISYPELFDKTLDYIHGVFSDHPDIDEFVYKNKAKEFYNMALGVVYKNDRIDLLESYKAGLIESISELRQDIDDHKAAIKKIRNSRTYRAGLAFTAPFKLARRVQKSLKRRLNK